MPMKINGMPSLQRIETSLKVLIKNEETMEKPWLYELVTGHDWIWDDPERPTIKDINQAAVDTIVSAFRVLGAE